MDRGHGRTWRLRPALCVGPGHASSRLGQLAQRALDVGCGEGRFCRMLKRNGVDVTGIDPTPTLIARARACDADGSYVEGAAEHLPFDNETFDLADRQSQQFQFGVRRRRLGQVQRRRACPLPGRQLPSGAGNVDRAPRYPHSQSPSTIEQ